MTMYYDDNEDMIKKFSKLLVYINIEAAGKNLLVLDDNETRVKVYFKIRNLMLNDFQKYTVKSTEPDYPYYNFSLTSHNGSYKLTHNTKFYKGSEYTSPVTRFSYIIEYQTNTEKYHIKFDDYYNIYTSYSNFSRDLGLSMIDEVLREAESERFDHKMEVEENERNKKSNLVDSLDIFSDNNAINPLDDHEYLSPSEFQPDSENTTSSQTHSSEITAGFSDSILDIFLEFFASYIKVFFIIINCGIGYFIARLLGFPGYLLQWINGPGIISGWGGWVIVVLAPGILLGGIVGKIIFHIVDDLDEPDWAYLFPAWLLALLINGAVIIIWGFLNFVLEDVIVFSTGTSRIIFHISIVVQLLVFNFICLLDD